MDEQALLARHDRLWKRRSEALRRWQDLWSACERQREAVRRQTLSGELAVRRAAGGLDARQRRWAEQHSTYAARPSSRVGRQRVVAWLYRREKIHAAEARALDEAEAAARTLAHADADLAEATRQLVAVWGQDAAAVTGQSSQRLRALSRSEGR